jgi:hypothetical protein
MDMARQIGTILLYVWGLAIFLGVGVLCTFYPHVVQRTERIGPINLRPPFEFLRRQMARPEYIYQVRTTGILALLGAAMVLYDLVRSFIH